MSELNFFWVRILINIRFIELDIYSAGNLSGRTFVLSFYIYGFLGKTNAKKGNFYIKNSIFYMK